MTRRTAMSRPKGAGFTLVELMVTLAIAAILAAIAIPAYNTSIRKSRRTLQIPLLHIPPKISINEPGSTLRKLLTRKGRT